MKMIAQSERIEAEINKIYEESDIFFLRSIYVNVAITLLLAAFYGNWDIAALFLVILVATQLIGHKLIKNRTLKTYIIAVIFECYPLLFMAITNGITEIRFLLYIYVFIVSIYQLPSLVLLGYFLSVMGTLALFLPVIYNWNSKEFVEKYFIEEGFGTPERMFLALFAITGAYGVSYFYTLFTKKRSIAMIEKQLENEIRDAQIAKNLAIAKEIANGNYQIQVEITENDNLGMALNNMRENLLAAAEKEQQDRFVNVGIAEVSEILRNQYNSVTELCVALIEKLVTYMKANQGAIFILHSDSEDVYLKLEACYAYQKRRFVEKQIRQGEGILGQVLLEKLPVYLSKVPKDYVRITSGLGKATPTFLCAIPLVANDEIAGVLEIASFQILTPHERLFLEKAAESIAITINAAKVNERTRQLLEESQMQAEMMKAQEEEMRQNMEELQAIQEEMERKNQTIS
jgi:methyl-accepting chemotaxis protein